MEVPRWTFDQILPYKMASVYNCRSINEWNSGKGLLTHTRWFEDGQ